VKIPQPPEFTSCVAQKRKTTPKPAKGQPQPKESDFKAQCKQEYEGLRDQVMQLLIQNEWVANEAKQQNVKVSDADVKKAFDDQKKQSFPKEADYKNFLKTSGFTEEDIFFRVRLEQLSNKLREKVTKGKDKVSDKQIQTYYDKNKKRFAQPERRDLRIVLTRDRAKAEQAKSAVEGGQSWKSVAKKFSIDQASKTQGGVLLAVAQGQQEPALDKAVFAAQKGELTGPVKTQFGFYVFAVQKITPKSQQTQQQASQTIKGILASENQQKALDQFIKDFQKEWKEKTNCRKGYVTQDCKNAPKQETTNTVPPGAVPQTPQGDGAQPVPPPGAPQAPPGGAPQPRRAAAAAPRPPVASGAGVAPDEVTAALGRLDALTRRAAGCECPGTPSRTSARSSRTRSRRPTSWPTPRTRRRRQAPRRARRRALPGPLPVLLLEERGAGSLATWPSTCARSSSAPPARLQCRRGRGAGEVLANWTRSRSPRPGASPGSSARSREPARPAVRRARSSGARRRRASRRRSPTCTRWSTRRRGSTRSATCSSRSSTSRGGEGRPGARPAGGSR
jgi:foldase protein PrsA